MKQTTSPIPLMDEAHLRKVTEVYKRLHKVDYDLEWINSGAKSAEVRVFGHVGGVSGPHSIDVQWDDNTQKAIALMAYHLLAKKRFYIIEELRELGFLAEPTPPFKFEPWSPK